MKEAKLRTVFQAWLMVECAGFGLQVGAGFGAEAPPPHPSIQIGTSLPRSADLTRAYIVKADDQAFSNSFDTAIHDAPRPRGEWILDGPRYLWILSPAGPTAGIAPSGQATTALTVPAGPLTQEHVLSVTATWGQTYAGPSGPGAPNPTVVTNSCSDRLILCPPRIDLEGHDAFRAQENLPVGEGSEENPGVFIGTNDTNAATVKAKLVVKASGVSGLTRKIDFGPNYSKIMTNGAVLAEQTITLPGDSNADWLVKVTQATPWAANASVTAVLRVYGGTAPVGSDTVKLVAMKADFVKMWETKNKANQIFNPTRKDDPRDDTQQPDANGDTYGVPRHCLYMVPDPLDGTYKITISATIQPADVRTRFYAAGCLGHQIVSGSGRVPFDADGNCEVNFLHPGSSPGIQDFVLRAGFDLNGNNQLDDDESMSLLVIDTITGQVVGDPTIRGTSPSRYDTVKGYIDNTINTWARPHAAELLRIFRDGNASGVPADKKPTLPAGSRPLNAMGGIFSEWLTHNSGASFSDSGQVTLNEYTWEPPSELSTLIGDAKEMRAAITTFYNGTVKSEAMNSLPVGATAWYPPSNGWYDVSHPHRPAWVPQYTVDLHDNSWLGDSVDDVNGSVGRGRLTSHKVRYHIAKKLAKWPPFQEYLVVDQIRSIGEILDLYDFNYESGGLIGAAQWAATLQIGYGKGAYGTSRDRGKIFFSRFVFDVTYEGIP